MDLTQIKRVPCEGGVPPIEGEEILKYLSFIQPSTAAPSGGAGWKVEEGRKIVKVFKFKDFKEAISFVDKVARLAEEEGHHPDIIINYNLVTIQLWTHAIGGLSENDFVVAAKIERLTTNN